MRVGEFRVPRRGFTAHEIADLVSVLAAVGEKMHELVGDDGEDLVARELVDQVVVDHHPARRAEAGDVGVQRGRAPGRVGDSSLIGCGCYADDQTGAVSCTGWGEPIMKLVLGKWATDRIAGGSPPELAAKEAIGYLSARVDGHGGMILLDSRGRYGIAHNTPRMAWGIRTQSEEQIGIELQQ